MDLSLIREQSVQRSFSREDLYLYVFYGIYLRPQDDTACRNANRQRKMIEHETAKSVDSASLVPVSVFFLRQEPKREAHFTTILEHRLERNMPREET